MRIQDLGGLRVLSLESRRAKEVATLIQARGGVPTVAPVVQELSLPPDPEVVGELLSGAFDMIVFLTGGGAKRLFEAMEAQSPRTDWIAALVQARLVARGPKPAAALRELGLQAGTVAPEPCTWRELLAAIDSDYPGGLGGMRIAVQEYGVSNEPLVHGFLERGAHVTSIRVYRWGLPENVSQAEAAIRGIQAGDFDIVLFLTAVQADHLCRIADRHGSRSELLHGLKRVVTASIGPSTSAELLELGITPDFEPSHPRMGILIAELAQAARDLVSKKRQGSTGNHASPVPRQDERSSKELWRSRKEGD